MSTFTTIESVEVKAGSGVVFVVLKKRPLDPDSEDEQVRGGHRLSIEPGADMEEVFTMVNAALTRMGVAPIDAAGWARVCAHCATAWGG